MTRNRLSIGVHLQIRKRRHWSQYKSYSDTNFNLNLGHRNGGKRRREVLLEIRCLTVSPWRSPRLASVHIVLYIPTGMCEHLLQS